MDVARVHARRSSSAFTRAATDPPTILEGQPLRAAAVDRSQFPMPGTQPAWLLHLAKPLRSLGAGKHLPLLHGKERTVVLYVLHQFDHMAYRGVSL